MPFSITLLTTSYAIQHLVLCFMDMFREGLYSALSTSTTVFSSRRKLNPIITLNGKPWQLVGIHLMPTWEFKVKGHVATDTYK